MNDLEEYKVDKKKLNKEQVMNYWVRLYPECKNKEEVEQIINCISKRSLEDYWEAYEHENHVLVEIKELYTNLKENMYKENKYMERVNAFCEKIRVEDKWSYFYVPMLYKHIEKVYVGIEHAEIIADCDVVVEATLRDIADKLSDASYRMLAGELHVAADAKQLKGKTPKERGEYFSSQLLRDMDYLEELYLSYPELYKVMDRMVSYNIQYVLEIIQNTEKEYQNIKKKLDIKKLGKLEKICLGSGDTHDHGRTVAQLHFEDGVRIMYKPRSFEMEHSYQKLVEWVNSAIPNFLPLRACKIHSIDGAGWVEFIENLPCKTEKEVQQFYARMGEVLCILYTLNAKDFHCENVIAQGAYPMLIDVETLLHSDIVEEKVAGSIEEVICDVLAQGVHTTALLPTLLQNYHTNDTMEVGAISSGRKRKSPFKARVLRNRESDEVTIESEQKEIPLNNNLPIYKEEKIGGTKYFKEVRDAFIETYQWVLIHKDVYIAKLYELFENVECRVLCKTTNNYTQLLHTSYHPDLLHNKMDREIYFHRLGILYEEGESNQALFQDEISSMMQEDVPSYHMSANDTQIYNGTKKIEMQSKESPLQKIERKIQGMSAVDLKRQVSLIYFSYMGCSMETDLLEGTKMKLVEDGEAQYPYNLAEESRRIAREIQERAVCESINGKRCISWLSYQGKGEEACNIVPAGWDIYKGNCGVALYFLKLAQMTGEKEFLEFGKDTLNSVEQILIHLNDEDYKMMGAGAFTGIAGYLYVCSKMMQMGVCKEEEKWEQIESVLQKIREHIHEEEKDDVLGGVAGTLGVLTTLYEQCTGDLAGKVKAVIGKIAELLLQRASLVEQNHITWFDNGDIGYVHGNAGIMAHLARANTILQDERITECIRMGLNYERSRYDEKRGVWNLRENAHYFSWCNGISGIMLAKIILCQSGMESSELQREIHMMCEQLKETGFGYDVCLCHGDMGTLCILKYVAEFLGDTALEKKVSETTQLFVKDELHNSQRFVLEDWGLMTGVAGLGLGVLEQASEDSYLASVLCLM
ncbi:type 2 lanthipeptide synthetase LanM [Anaerosporobacter sp.]|uniref:type 2 lanthipeptide synthetase LanM n=1 Tax=Anaerosporobacter sp. TaxID=1872529 RepID=UPI00286EBADD|nr:type 2 lanthipeptide synthetase LanM [Anaerosporobacter sp.]